MIPLAQIDATPRGNPVEDPLQTRLGDIDSAKYRRNTESVVRTFGCWLARERDVAGVEEIGVQDLRKYARRLNEAVDDDASPIGTNSTAEQYYAVVSAFLSWCVDEGLLDTNPARRNTARKPLPESDRNPDREFWSARERKALCATADRAVDEVLNQADAREHDRLMRFRDRALVYALGYTGCRGAELAAVPDDAKRRGVRWSHVNLETGVLMVYGKNREWEDAPIFEQAQSALRRWRQVLAPETDEWPVFPTGHFPSLYDTLPTDVKSSPKTVWCDLREHECVPPSLGVEGVRSRLRDLCAQSQYEFDDVPKPHGARRGLGDELYDEQAELAQEALRHKNIETTHESYREERTRQVKERGDEVLE